MNDPAAVFPALSAILRRHAQGMTIRTDERGHLYVELAPVTARAKTRFFGAVQVRKSYVSYHLMPVYENLPSMMQLKESILPALRGVPYVAGADPVVFAWYPGARAGLVWNLEEQPRSYSVVRDGKELAQVSVPALGVEIIGDL